jgi:hypothetical protein
MRSLEERWIHWWCAPWHWAHPVWMARFAEQNGLPQSDADDLVRVRPGAFLQSIGIEPSQPPQPVESLVQWLTLSPEQQQQALKLVGRICLSRSTGIAPDQHEVWCRSVAKALRPGAWLHSSHDDPRLLLAVWTGETCWPRLRLTWAPGDLAETFVDLPANKLQTLWQSVLWRVMTP